jgi:hypothetical protein
MQDIEVRRYEDASHGYQGTLSPADGSWIAFVPREGAPQLWMRNADGSYSPV